jgi:hypothetical protein
VFTFSADNFKSLEQWIHYLTVCSLEYIQAMLSGSSDQQKVEDKADDKEEQPKEEQSKVKEEQQPEIDGKTNKPKAKNNANTPTKSSRKR